MKTKRIRFRQKDYKIENAEDYLKDWTIEKYGCGPTSIANILVNFDYDVNPLYITKKLFLIKK